MAVRRAPWEAVSAGGPAIGHQESRTCVVDLDLATKNLATVLIFARLPVWVRVGLDQSPIRLFVQCEQLAHVSELANQIRTEV